MIRMIVSAAMLAFALSSVQAEDFAFDVPALQEQAVDAGINHVYDGPWEFFVGGGYA